MFPPRHMQNAKSPSNTLKGDSPPPHQFARHGAHAQTTNHPAGLARGSAPSSLLQGHPPSLRFGHPDVATEATETSTHPPNRCSYVFRKRPQGVARTLSVAKQGGAERPGDGCPCVGAEETCSAPRSLGRSEVPTHPTPAGARMNTDSSTHEDCISRGTQKSRRFRRISGIFFNVRPLGLEPRTH